MNIVLFTNTYRPHVGGVARSVERLEKGIRAAGHKVRIVAPVFGEEDESEPDVIRLPAIQDFNGSDFSVKLPVPVGLREKLHRFSADLLHAQHPFLLGDTALRMAESENIPLVFTHHTMYEQYTHYVPADSKAMKRFVIELCTGYANLCDHVIAPSGSIADILKKRGVDTPITPIPTGVDLDEYRSGKGDRARAACNIPTSAFLVGHVGRLAPEKNLRFLARAVAQFLTMEPEGHFVVVGDGPEKEAMQEVAVAAGVQQRVHFTGVKKGQELVDLYHAMDLFAFTSKSETQGMVLAEAMAAETPVVALDANGVRDIITDEQDGYLIDDQNEKQFAEAIRQVAQMPAAERQSLKDQAVAKAEDFSIPVCLKKVLAIYEEMYEKGRSSDNRRTATGWDELLGAVHAEWDVWSNRLNAVVEAFNSDESTETDAD